MTVLLPTVIIVFGLVIYYWFTIRALKKNRTESDKYADPAFTAHNSAEVGRRNRIQELVSPLFLVQV